MDEISTANIRFDIIRPTEYSSTLFVTHTTAGSEVVFQNVYGRSYVALEGLFSRSDNTPNTQNNGKFKVVVRIRDSFKDLLKDGVLVRVTGIRDRRTKSWVTLSAANQQIYSLQSANRQDTFGDYVSFDFMERGV